MKLPSPTTILWLLLLAFASLLTVAICSPLLQPTPGRDSGVYMTAASRLLAGEIPYKDIWDHKPPGIFFIDAFALALGHRSLWSLWILDYLTVFGSASVIFFLTRKHFHLLPTLLSMILFFVCTLLIVDSGNNPETFILLCNSITLWLLYGIIKTQKVSARNVIALGVLASIVALLKPNLLGLYVVSFVYLFRVCAKKSRNTMVALYIGSALPLLAACVGFFAMHNSLNHSVDAVIYYNRIYSSVSLINRLDGIKTGLQILIQGAIGIFALTGWIIAVISLQYKKSMQKTFPLLVLTVLLFPLDLLLTGWSGRYYLHYYLPLLPSLTFLSAYLFYTCIAYVQKPIKQTWGTQYVPIYLVAVLGLFYCALLMKSLSQVPHIIHVAVLRDSAYRQIRSYIAEHTTKNDTIAIWGNETGLYFTSERRYPSRYVYAYPLVTKTYQIQSMNEFNRDVTKKPPTLIIDVTEGDNIMASTEHRYTSPVYNEIYGLTRSNLEFFYFWRKNYRLVKQTEGYFTWKIYQRINS